MKAAVITFPGSNCDRDLLVALKAAGADVTRVWHKDEALPQGTDLVAVPGGFSFGDYLRCGAIARWPSIASLDPAIGIGWARSEAALVRAGRHDGAPSWNGSTAAMRARARSAMSGSISQPR